MRISVPPVYQVRNVTEQEGAVLPAVVTLIRLHPTHVRSVRHHRTPILAVSCFQDCTPSPTSTGGEMAEEEAKKDIDVQPK
jgi:hypothetical protein